MIQYPVQCQTQMARDENVSSYWVCTPVNEDEWSPRSSKPAWCHLVTCPTEMAQRNSLQPASQGHSSLKEDSFFPPDRQNRVIRRKPLFKAVAKSQSRKLIYVIKNKTHHRFTLAELEETPNPARTAQPEKAARLCRLCVQTASEEETSHYLVENPEAPRVILPEMWSQRVTWLWICCALGQIVHSTLFQSLEVEHISILFGNKEFLKK